MSTIKDYFSHLNEVTDHSESENTTAIDAIDYKEPFAADDDKSISSCSVSGVKRKAACGID